MHANLCRRTVTSASVQPRAQWNARDGSGMKILKRYLIKLGEYWSLSGKARLNGYWRDSCRLPRAPAAATQSAFRLLSSPTWTSWTGRAGSRGRAEERSRPSGACASRSRTSRFCASEAGGPCGPRWTARPAGPARFCAGPRTTPSGGSRATCARRCRFSRSSSRSGSRCAG